MSEDVIAQLRQLLPNLEDLSSIIITSNATNEYNCVGWALNKTEWYEPGFVWPEGLLEDDTLAAYVELFIREGYIFDGTYNYELELGYEKVAVYGTVDKVEHVSRQLPNGKWTSKLGTENDVEHNLFDLDDHYGPLIGILKRKQD